MSIYIYIYIYYRFIVRFPIGLDFLFITFTILLHLLLSWTSSLSISSSAISTSTLSNHVFLGLPTGLLPSTLYSIHFSIKIIYSTPTPHITLIVVICILIVYFSQNKVKVVALKTTNNISLLIKDLFHNPPSYKVQVNLSWKPLVCLCSILCHIIYNFLLFSVDNKLFLAHTFRSDWIMPMLQYSTIQQ